MKLPEENYTGSISTISTDIVVSENKQSNNVSVNTISEDLSLKNNEEKNGPKEPFWKIRYCVVLVLFLLYFFNLYLRLNMSITIVAMVNNSAISRPEQSIKSESCASLIQNYTEDGKRLQKEGDFDWSPKLQGYILATSSFGQFAARIPSGLFAERYGAKWLIFGSTLMTAVLTLFIPVLSYLSFYVLMVCLILRGFILGLLVPALTTISVNWFPRIERGFFMTFTMSGAPVGSVLGSIFSGLICDSAGGWKASFYVTGAFGVFLSLLILLFVFENPKAHPRISQAELNFILSNQENVLLRKRPKLPWRRIMTSVPVYALIACYCGQAWAMGLFSTVQSTFLATILHYPIRENGIFTALPFILQFLVSQITSWITLYIQRKKIWSVDFLRKFWTFIGSAGYSLCLLGICLSGCNRTLSVIFSVLCTGFTGFAFSGCWIVPTDMTPTFGGTLNAICLTLGLPAAFLLPISVGYLTNEMQSLEQWNKVFYLSIGIVMSTGIIFVIFGSAEVQPWNFVEEKVTVKEKTETYTSKEKSVNDKDEELTRF